MSGSFGTFRKIPVHLGQMHNQAKSQANHLVHMGRVKDGFLTSTPNQNARNLSKVMNRKAVDIMYDAKEIKQDDSAINKMEDKR